jgi:hypothetical protein
MPTAKYVAKAAYEVDPLLANVQDQIPYQARGCSFTCDFSTTISTGKEFRSCISYQRSLLSLQDLIQDKTQERDFQAISSTRDPTTTRLLQQSQNKPDQAKATSPIPTTPLYRNFRSACYKSTYSVQPT